MKLNLWQWIGILLLVVGVALWIYKKSTQTTTPGNPTTRSANR
jgi:drug/metabolite transporter (DMT)-like permease